MLLNESAFSNSILKLIISSMVHLFLSTDAVALNPNTKERLRINVSNKTFKIDYQSLSSLNDLDFKILFF